MQPSNVFQSDQNYIPKTAIREQIGKSETSGFLVPSSTNFYSETPGLTSTSSSGASTGVSGMLHNLQAKLKSHTTSLGKPRRLKAMHRDSEERFRVNFENLVREPILFEQQCKAITSNRIITGTVFLTPSYWCFAEIPSSFTGTQTANRIRFILPLSEVTSIQRGLIVNPNESVLNVVPTPGNFDPFTFRDVDNLVIQLFDKQGRVHEFCDLLAFSQAYNTLWFVWNHRNTSTPGLNQPSLISNAPQAFVAQPLPPPLQTTTVPTKITSTMMQPVTTNVPPMPPPPPMPPMQNTTMPPFQTQNATTMSQPVLTNVPPPPPIPPPMATTNVPLSQMNANMASTTSATPRASESLLDLPPAKLQESPYK